MNEQLTAATTTRHTNNMAESNSEELNIMSSPIEENDFVKREQSLDEKIKKEGETVLKKDEKVLSEEIKAIQNQKDNDNTFEEIVKDVSEEDRPFYKGLWDKMKATFSDKEDLQDIILDDTSTHLHRVYSLRGIKDLITLKSYTTVGSDLFQRYSQVFKEYAFRFEGSYTNEFGTGGFNGSALDFLDRARYEYVSKVKKIIETARHNRDFDAAQKSLSNIEDEVVTRQLQLEQLDSVISQHHLGQLDEIKGDEDQHIDQWPVIKQPKKREIIEKHEDKKEEGKLGISSKIVELNAAIKDDDKRADKGLEILKQFEEKEFTPKQKEEIKKVRSIYLPNDIYSSEQKEVIQRGAIKDAHHVGSEHKESYVYNYSLAELRQKYQILQKAGFSKDQIRVLMEHGVVGSAPPEVGSQLSEELEKIKKEQEESDRRSAEAINKNAEMNKQFREDLANDPQFPQDEDSEKELLKKITMNTGIHAETLLFMKEQFSMFVDLTAQNWRELLWCEKQQAGYMLQTLEGLKRSNWTLENYLEEAREQTRIMKQEPYSITSKRNIIGLLDNALNLDELETMVRWGGDFASYYATALGSYRENLEGEYEPNIFGDDITTEGASKDDFKKMQRDYYEKKVIPEFLQMVKQGVSLEEAQDFLKNEVEKYSEYLGKAQNSTKGKERQNRQIESIEELAEAIMDTHPEFAQGTLQELLYSEDKMINGKIEHRKGDLNKENFMNWIHSQLQYYHDQDPDNPQLNFMSSINIDIPDMFRTVNILTMINNPGRYFKDKYGVELVDLKNEVTNATWLWGDIRNKDITYRLIMPMDEKIGEALMNMYQNNVLTKMTGDGTPPIHWILSQAERFGGESGDKKIGMAVLESLMIYYNLTDFPELYDKYAGQDAPLFNLKEIKKTIQELIVNEKLHPDDPYLLIKDWADLMSFFNEKGEFIVPGDKKAEINFAKFFNLYEPEKNPRLINLIRALVRKTVQNKYDLSTKNIQYAEQFSQFFLRFTLAAARADLGAPAMDAGEKVMRLYLHEKGPNATNPGYGNIKAVALRRALGLDFFAGTYVLTQEYKDLLIHRVKQTPIIQKKTENGPVQIPLQSNEEIIILHPSQVIESDGQRKWLRSTDEIKRSFYTDVPEEKRANNQEDEYYEKKTFERVEVKETEDNTILLDNNGVEIFNFKEQERILKNLYGEEYDVIPDITSLHINNERGRYNVTVQLTVRKWNTSDYAIAASNKRVVINRHLDGRIEVIDELSNTDKIIIGDKKDEKGKKEHIFLENKNNEEIKFIESVIYTTVQEDKKAKKNIINTKKVQLKDNEYYDGELLAICDYSSGKIIRQFSSEESPVYVGREKYITQQRPQQKSTLRVLQEMHKTAQEYRNLETNEDKEKLYDEYGIVSSQLAYKTDTMRQFSSNHLARIFQMFHEELQKDLIDVSSFIKGWDEKKHRWVFDESKIQEIFTEQLYKRRRYAYRTYGIYMGEIIRGIGQTNTDEFETMTVAEHLFGRKVLETFRKKDGTIDYEYLSTPKGIGELFKTELIMRLAAEEAKFSDKKYPEKGMALHLKLAYREALRKGIASNQYIDEDDPKASQFMMETFKGRNICEDPEENERALDYMDIYTRYVGATDRQLITRQARWEIGHAFLPGIWDAFKEFVDGTFKN